MENMEILQNSKNFVGLGKRKTSVAKVFLKEGSGIITWNKKNLDNFFSEINYEQIKLPFLLLNLEKKYDIDIKVKGGGISGQLEAIRLAISKALTTIDLKHRPILKQNLFLRRDSRIKERRKYGLRKARKAPQYSKR
jgi:small subunit ribosomal protein S9